MGVIFLIFCSLALLTGASAQQANLFDVQKHLQLKKTGEKKPSSLFKKINPPRPFNSYFTRPFSQKPFLLNGNSAVLSFPAFRMPVVVPDMRLFETMPNPGKDYAAGNFYRNTVREPFNIPNASPPMALLLGTGWYQ